jgi:hypothetical protein
MNTTATLALALSTTLSPAQTGPDLVFNSIEIASIEWVDNRFEIAFDFEIINVGPALIDLGGPDPFTNNDNVGIQTYLSTNEDLTGPVFAASGWALDPVVLNPNDSYFGTLYANTIQLPDPTSIDPFNWLAVEIITTMVPSEMNKNNLEVLYIPTPGSSTLLALGALATTRRRR